eukprot:Lithocolla_globosa_v1_NODE_4916_length_1340_cov_3.569650.p1 type:complete len:264 gc:universal NODE_4916_length_1340_cov_3.569650:843-52(-)
MVAEPIVRVFAKDTDIPRALASFVETQSREAVKNNGKFTIGLSGGSLPKTLGAGLSSEPFKSAIDWSKWHVFFVDERCVPLDDKDSNYKACKKEFFEKVSIPDSQIYAINPDLAPAECAADYAKKIEAVIPDYNFDLLLLGMGPDGHTCSLFPWDHLLSKKEVTVASILNSPKKPPQRVTLTMPAVNKAKQVAFVTTGAPKADAIGNVLEGDQALKERYPSMSVKPEGSAVMWFIDGAASSALTSKTKVVQETETDYSKIVTF